MFFHHVVYSKQIKKKETIFFYLSTSHGNIPYIRVFSRENGKTVKDF